MRLFCNFKSISCKYNYDKYNIREGYFAFYSAAIVSTNFDHDQLLIPNYANTKNN